MSSVLLFQMIFTSIKQWLEAEAFFSHQQALS